MALDADPYRTLGLTRGATLDEVKRAYRRLAKVNHPDAAGPAALPQFLAIQAAYEQLSGGSDASLPGGRGAPTAQRRPSAADSDRTDATHRAYGGRARGPGPTRGATGGAGPTRGTTDSGGPTRGATGGGGPTRGAAGDAGPAARDRGHGRGPHDSGRTRPGEAAGPAGRPPDRSADSGAEDGASQGASHGRRRGKATLGSTSYDGADSGPFEPDWGGASWYGTTSGTYWTINPKEYADPRKHGPEYQARARRGPRAGAAGDPAAGPTRPTSSSWNFTSGPASAGPAAAAGPAASAGRPQPGAAEPLRTPEPALDIGRAVADLGRALTDPRAGGLRARIVRSFLGWFPIALGLGWLIGELSGCGRFAATCDPSVVPLTAIGQGTVLMVLLLLPEIGALAGGAALVVLAVAMAASLVLSATGAAADEGSRRTALGMLLLVAWLSGLAMAIVRRLRAGPRTAGPVS